MENIDDLKTMKKKMEIIANSISDGLREISDEDLDNLILEARNFITLSDQVSFMLIYEKTIRGLKKNSTKNSDKATA